MSRPELARFFRAINTLKDNGQGPSRYDAFVRLHLDNMPNAHGVPEFLPWHRYFIRDFEKELQRIDPGVSLPYWVSCDRGRGNQDISPQFPHELIPLSCPSSPSP